MYIPGFRQVVLLSVQPALKNHKSSESQAKKHTSLKYYKKILRPDDIAPSIVPPLSHRPTWLLRVPPPIAPLAFSIAARAALRVSYSQLAAPKVWCSQHALRVSYSQCRPLRVWCSQREGTLARWCWESIILSAGGAGWQYRLVWATLKTIASSAILYLYKWIKYHFTV